MGGMHGFGRVEPEADEPVFRAVGGPHAGPDDRDRRTGRDRVRSVPPSSRSTRPRTWRRATTSGGPRRRGPGRGRRRRRAGRGRRGVGRRRAGCAPMPPTPNWWRWCPPSSTHPGGVGRARRHPVRGGGPRDGRPHGAGGSPPLPAVRAGRHGRGGASGRVAAAGRATPRRRTVRFAMRDLWGDDAEPGHLFIDLWEQYLT